MSDRVVLEPVGNEHKIIDGNVQEKPATTPAPEPAAEDTQDTKRKR